MPAFAGDIFTWRLLYRTGRWIYEHSPAGKVWNRLTDVSLDGVAEFHVIWAWGRAALRPAIVKFDSVSKYPTAEELNDKLNAWAVSQRIRIPAVKKLYQDRETLQLRFENDTYAEGIISDESLELFAEPEPFLQVRVPDDGVFIWRKRTHVYVHENRIKLKEFIFGYRLRDRDALTYVTFNENGQLHKIRVSDTESGIEWYPHELLEEVCDEDGDAYPSQG